MLTAHFNLVALSKPQLRGLYRALFNRLSHPDLSESEKVATYTQLKLIERLLSLGP